MIKDKLTELYNALKEDKTLTGISIKSFKRPETLSEKEPSIVIIPVGPLFKATVGAIQVCQRLFSIKST